MEFILEPQCEIPVLCDVDVCVIGGGCTGVFAAVRAARLGAKVALIERQNALGGVATGGLVNVWHSFYDLDCKTQIIAGLSQEVVDRLKQADAIDCHDKTGNPSSAYRFNPHELKIELDGLIKESSIQLYLHSFYISAIQEGRRVQAVIVGTKEGKRAVKAKFFIDASGDGDLARDLGIPSYTHDTIQPPTACFFMQGAVSGKELGDIVRSHGEAFGLDDDFGWGGIVPGVSGITMRADSHVFGGILNRAADLTWAELEGRRKMRAFTAMLKQYGSGGHTYALVDTCAQIGIRETVHFKTRFMATMQDLLTGRRYDTAVLNGTYRVDIHHSTDGGITFHYLDGKSVTTYGKGSRVEEGNWRKDAGLDDNYARFYQAPFEILVCEAYDNFIPVGRMLHADEGAFGALRVMVNLNQLGEAAGVAAYLCLQEGTGIGAVDGRRVQTLLKSGGSAIQ